MTRNSIPRTRSARRLNIHEVVRLEMKRGGVTRIHFQPGVRGHSLEDGHLAGLRARVPVLDGPPRVEDEGKLGIRLFRERFPLDAKQLRFSVFGRENSV